MKIGTVWESSVCRLEMFREISGSDGNEYEDDSPLGYYAMRNPHIIPTFMCTSSIFHMPCSTRGTNSSNEPHLVFAYCI
jgi:hypothetical protein